MASRGMSTHGKVRQSTHGVSSRNELRPGTGPLGEAVSDGQGSAARRPEDPDQEWSGRRGTVFQGFASLGTVRLGRLGLDRIVTVWCGMAALVRTVPASFGPVRLGCQGWARTGLSRLCLAVLARTRKSWLGAEWPSRTGEVGLVMVHRGMAAKVGRVQDGRGIRGLAA